MRLDHLGALRLELAQPVERAIEPVQTMRRDAAPASATMPTLVLPEPSGMSQTQ